MFNAASRLQSIARGGPDFTYAGTVLLLPFSADTNDYGPSALVGALTGAAALSPGTGRWGGSSLLVPHTAADSFRFTTAQAVFNLGAGDFTMEGWFNPAAIANTGFNSMLAFNGAVALNPFLQTSGGNMYFRGGLSGPELVPAFAHGMVNGTWYWVVAQRSGTTYSVYINGVLKSSSTGVAAPTSESKRLDIGGSPASSGGGNVAGWNGNYTGIRLSNRARYVGNNLTLPTGPWPTS